jgi:hypothetical protein
MLIPAQADVPIPCRIVALVQEQNRLFGYPLAAFAEEFRQIGLTCNRCGTCCTRAVNRHIFLLDRDVETVRAIDPGAYVPAPDPEFCDQNGTLYVSGYALRMDGDDKGSCRFLHEDRCRIYDRRFSVCRIYPHMLRREAGRAEIVSWCTFSRMNEHGRYHEAIPEDECLSLAREILEYENAFLCQQISFLETIHEYFTTRTLRHDPEMHKQGMQRIRQGRPVDIKVFHAGELEDCRMRASCPEKQ